MLWTGFSRRTDPLASVSRDETAQTKGSNGKQAQANVLLDCVISGPLFQKMTPILRVESSYSVNPFLKHTHTLACLCKAVFPR